MSNPEEPRVADPTAEVHEAAHPGGSDDAAGETLLHHLSQEPPIMHDPDPGSVAAGYSDEAVPTDVDDLPDSPDLPPSGDLGWQVRG